MLLKFLTNFTCPELRLGKFMIHESGDGISMMPMEHTQHDMAYKALAVMSMFVQVHYRSNRVLPHIIPITKTLPNLLI
ncbi:Hypothetical protein NTJ_00535 [Nesidiocoris tenuis]|uniref:Uncharacterized protein n=1 Tax=Nesidiocoris tenuis TaxID=355587 RepID=A0ABN7A672_9HEMI|nr:Hypothetical protein NTJ_00535 [Nesidiocoris tenuis]